MTEPASDLPGVEAFRKLPRDPARLDSLDLYAHVVGRGGGLISDPGRIEAALTTVRDNLVAVTGQESSLHGWRIQALFEAIVASLGRVRLLKVEDSGNVYISGPTMKPPDFRVILASNEQILVEVKSHFQKDPTDDYRIRRKDVLELERYAQTVGVTRVLLAVYWVKWNLWTLTDFDTLQDYDDARVCLRMPDAFKANEMGSVGDRTPATEWPLSLKFLSDPTKPRAVEGDVFPFTVGAVEVSVAGKQITDANEQNIVLRLALNSNWAETTDVEIVGGEAVAVRFDFAPEVPPDEQSFAMHAPLSSMFSSMFNRATIDEHGEITDLRLDVDPSALARLIPDDYEGEVLRVWRFHIQPS
jgi:hypothetical protein